MSEDCGNPNCNDHSPKAKELRQRVVTNVALMEIVRAIAANIMAEEMHQQGIDPRMLSRPITDVLYGNDDRDSGVQGTINALIKMLDQGHPQINQLVGALADIKEGDTFMEKIDKQVRAEREKRQAGGNGPTIEEIAAKLGGFAIPGLGVVMTGASLADFLGGGKKP